MLTNKDDKPVDFMFFEGLDFGGHNLTQMSASVPELAARARELPDCIAFNSLGFIKAWPFDMAALAHGCSPSPYFAPGDGLYVKTDVATRWFADWISVSERFVFMTQVTAHGVSDAKRTTDAAAAASLLSQLQLAHAVPTCIAVTGDGVTLCALTTLLPKTHSTGVWIKRVQYDTLPLVRAVRQLRLIHARIQPVFTSGSLADEMVEQIMSALVIRPSDVVLEIGGNIGRNSCVIASLLRQPSQQLLVLECAPASAAKLAANAAATELSFRIETAALSARRLEMNRPLDGYFALTREWTGTDASWHEIPTLTLAALRARYADMLPFTVLVADCEGALYTILQDTPEILDGLRAVLLENDYFGDDAAAQAAAVRGCLVARNFQCTWQHDLDAHRVAFWQIWQRLE